MIAIDYARFNAVRIRSNTLAKVAVSSMGTVIGPDIIPKSLVYQDIWVGSVFFHTQYASVIYLTQ
jgi:hypothetical protein